MEVKGDYSTFLRLLRIEKFCLFCLFGCIPTIFLVLFQLRLPEMLQYSNQLNSIIQTTPLVPILLSLVILVLIHESCYSNNNKRMKKVPLPPPLSLSLSLSLPLFLPPQDFIGPCVVDRSSSV